MARHFSCIVHVCILALTVKVDISTADTDFSAQMPNSKEYSPATLHHSTAGGLHFVMFYRTWSGHDKAATKYWEKLAQEYNTQEDIKVTLGHFDCTDEADFCVDLQATGFPTYKFFLNEMDTGVSYNGLHNYEQLKELIEQHPTTMAWFPLLSKSEFDNQVKNKTNPQEIKVLFYSSQCLDYTEVARMAFQWNTDKRQIYGVDCSQEDFCEAELESKRLPSMAIYKSGALLKKLFTMDFVDVHRMTYMFDHRLRNVHNEL